MKKLLSLLLVLALLCSAMCVLASCEPDDPVDDGGNDGPKGTIDVITDPSDPEAGGESEDNFVRE
ncbi:MAG: hypothetical protein J6S44_04625 [Clostridia bacterium]|nr:hypothetical protein [Clostridia bacterium]MBO7170628.1 hypothetical protein [Clostridia bacterium]